MSYSSIVPYSKVNDIHIVWHFHSLHDLASALCDYGYKASHNDTVDYTTRCEYH